MTFSKLYRGIEIEYNNNYYIALLRKKGFPNDYINYSYEDLKKQIDNLLGSLK